jgi:hypothetical protein
VANGPEHLRPIQGRALRLVTTVTLAVAWWLVPVAPAQAADAVLVGAGDIASCSASADSGTASLLGSSGGTVFTLGDNVYEDGSHKEFNGCYGPSWGRFKGRTRPAVGNHDYQTKGADGYFDYFGGAAGPRGKGWYSYNQGAWQVIVLNSNCDDVGCGKGSEQERWLRARLAAGKSRCTLAYWHHSRFASDKEHGNSPEVGPFWDALYDYGADLILGAHSHIYERFGPQTPSGKNDPAHGIREIVVGTGGEGLYHFGGPRPNSVVRNANTHGVLKLTLKPASYDWHFLPQGGKGFRDQGHGACHDRP